MISQISTVYLSDARITQGEVPAVRWDLYYSDADWMIEVPEEPVQKGFDAPDLGALAYRF